jgi:hypothetical protein
MRLERIGVVGVVAGVVLGGLVATAGCEGTDDTISGEEEAELQSRGRFHRRPRVADAGGVTGAAGTNGGAAGTNGGTAGTNGGTAADGGTVADCDVCTQAQQCCSAVGVQSCTFSAATCSSMVGDARPAYVRACLTQLWVTSNAWSANPPAECRR